MNPETITLGTGATTTKLSTSKDYVIKLPAGEKRGHTAIVGGRNVLIDGGTIVMSGSGTDIQRRGIYIKGATGTVRIQNVTIRGARSNAAFDAVAISAPLATVELVDIQVSNLTGSVSGFHGDIVQPFGGVKKLVINGLTGRTGYQGFYLAETNGRIGAVELRDVNLSYDDNSSVRSSVMIWFDGCSSYPVMMQNVVIQPRSGQDVARSVRPNSGSCRPVRSGNSWAWPSSSSIDGSITQGSSTGGSGTPDDREESDSQPSSVRIQAPNRVRAGARVKVAARGNDNARLAAVSFGVCSGSTCTWSSARKLGTDNAAPFSTTWQAPKRGTHTFVAQVTDEDGTVTVSKPKQITIKAGKAKQRKKRR